MRGLFMFVFSMLAMIFVSEAFAQAAVIAAPTYFDSTLAWLTSNVGMVASGVGVLEVVLRLFPSVNPLSVLIPVQYAVVGVGKILQFLGDNVLTPMISAFQVTSSK